MQRFFLELRHSKVPRVPERYGNNAGEADLTTRWKATILDNFPISRIRFQPSHPRLGFDRGGCRRSRLIFKFPRNGDRGKIVDREISLLGVIRPAVAMPVPDIPPDRRSPDLLVSSRKLKGSGYLETHHYIRHLPAKARRISHYALRVSIPTCGLDIEAMRAAGASPGKSMVEADEVHGKGTAASAG